MNHHRVLVSPRSEGVRLVVAALLAVLASCVPSSTEIEDAIPSFDEDTMLGGIQAQGTLTVALDRDAPPLSSWMRDHPRGLAVEVASAVADALGVEPEFVPASSSEELAAMVEQGDADLAFPLIPLTSPALREMSFSDPYYIGHQRLLVRKGSAISDIGDLAGERVCSAINPATEVPVDKLVPGIEVVEGSGVTDCGRAVASGRAGAATALDLALMQVVARSAGVEIVGDALSSEGFGALAAPEASRLANFIDGVLNDAIDDGAYVQWYERWIAPYSGGTVPEPPDLTAEEAAAFFPAETISTEG